MNLRDVQERGGKLMQSSSYLVSAVVSSLDGHSFEMKGYLLEAESRTLVTSM